MPPLPGTGWLVRRIRRSARRVGPCKGGTILAGHRDTVRPGSKEEPAVAEAAVP